jgi:hypothetical protein
LNIFSANTFLKANTYFVGRLLYSPEYALYGLVSYFQLLDQFLTRLVSIAGFGGLTIDYGLLNELHQLHFNMQQIGVRVYQIPLPVEGAALDDVALQKVQSFYNFCGEIDNASFDITSKLEEILVKRGYPFINKEVVCMITGETYQPE